MDDRELRQIATEILANCAGKYVNPEGYVQSPQEVIDQQITNAVKILRRMAAGRLALPKCPKCGKANDIGFEDTAGSCSHIACGCGFSWENSGTLADFAQFFTGAAPTPKAAPSDDEIP